MLIGTWQDREAAHRRVGELLAAGPAEVLNYVDSAKAAPGWEVWVVELQAVTRITLGSITDDAGMVEDGMTRLRSSFSHDDPSVAYNLANGHAAIWEISLRGHRDVVHTLLTARHHLHAARRLYERVGADERGEPALRAEALVNAANSYDNLGRDQDALALWDRALALKPDFAMAHGNRGIALLMAARFANEHSPMLAAEAAWELDQALADPESIVRYGQPGALDTFQDWRGRLGPDTQPLPDPAGPWEDAHLQWCRDHELFLNTSHRCLTEDQPHLDALVFSALSGPIAPDGHQRADDLSDSINGLKQEYVSVRYLTWAALDPDSTIAQEAAALKARVRFIDSLNMARWGLRTGLAVQAFVSTTNLLDKIAVVTHAYFDTGRNPKKVAFRAFWRITRDKQEAFDPTFEAAFALGWNPGLAALCDLANDLEDETPLTRLVAMRHAATHRLLIAHDGPAPDAESWLTRIDFAELAQRSVEQLRLTRAAFIYLLRAIDAHEHHSEQHRDGLYLPLPTFDGDPDLSELDGPSGP